MEKKADDVGAFYEYEEEDDFEDEPIGTLDLATHNVGAGSNGCGCCVRTLVSKKKRRFIAEGVDLDLSYITNRVIAMGYPASGWETLWRNPADAVRTFLESRHKFHYRIWNLCCEREYGTGGFNCEVERFAWADHTPPPLAMMLPACESLDSWLEADKENVVVIHCKAGKGRTGTLIAAYLAHARLCPSADEAIALFGIRRTKNGRGITIPSQQRYVKYYALQLAALRYAADHLTSAGSAAPTAKADLTASAPDVAHAFIVRQDVDIAYNMAHKDAAPKSRITVQITRDAARTPGFTVDLNEAHIPVVTKFIGATATQSASTAGSGIENSVLPVPLHNVLRLGDEIVAVNGVELAHRSFSEIVSILRGALDPLRVEIRRAENTTAKSTSPLSAGEAIASGDYLTRIARAVGPWASGSEPRLVPRPQIRINGIFVSHLPDLSSKTSCSPCAASHSAGWFVRVYGGPSCKTILYDSRRSTTSYALAFDSTAVRDADATGASKTIELPSLSAPGATAPAFFSKEKAQMVWDASTFRENPCVCAGDARLVLMKEGHKKPFAGIWFHTACLPIPSEMHAVVQGAMASSLAAEDSTVLPKPAIVDTATTSKLDETGGTGLLTKEVGSPTTPDDTSLLSATPLGTPNLVGAAKNAETKPASLDAVKPRVSGRQSTALRLRNTIIQSDVPGGKIGTGTPLLGSLFTAAGGMSDAVSPSATPATSFVFFKKAEIDGAVKDKKHRIFPAGFSIGIDFCVDELPDAYQSLKCGRSDSAPKDVALRI